MSKPAVTCLCLILFVLAGCSPRDAESLWADYLQRLENLTGIPVPGATPARRPRYPAQRELSRPLLEQRIGLIRFVSLLECDLMELVSARNSSLGRVQATSYRLDHELRFISRAEQCLTDGTLDENPDMLLWLREVVDEKRNDLGNLAWNMTFAGPELAGFFRQRPVPADRPVSADWPATVRALEQLTNVSNGLRQSAPTSLDPAIERALEALDKSSAAGQALDALALAQRDLQRATGMLAQIDTSRLCPHGRPSERARNLQRGFLNIYVARMQPWLADLSRAADAFAEAIIALRDAQADVDADALDNWLNSLFGDSGLLPAYRTAVVQHAHAWQRVLGDCGMTPDPSHTKS